MDTAHSCANDGLANSTALWENQLISFLYDIIYSPSQALFLTLKEFLTEHNQKLISDKASVRVCD